MFNKFKEGLLFGAGFTISFVSLWYLATYLLQPIIAEIQLEKLNKDYPVSIMPKSQSSQSGEKSTDLRTRVPFHALGIDDQIKNASVIALAKYKPGHDDQMKAIITEFLKKEPKVTIYYDIGDEYQLSSYYPKENESHGDGVIIFFTGSPATMRMSMTYSGDRIRGLGDLPIDLFRDMCREK